MSTPPSYKVCSLTGKRNLEARRLGRTFHMGFWVKTDAQAAPHHLLPKAARLKKKKKSRAKASQNNSYSLFFPYHPGFGSTRLRKPDQMKEARRFCESELVRSTDKHGLAKRDKNHLSLH